MAKIPWVSWVFAFCFGLVIFNGKIILRQFWDPDIAFSQRRFILHMRKKVLTVRAVMHWHRLPRNVVAAPPLETFKVRLDGALSTCQSRGCLCSLRRSWSRWPFNGPFQIKQFYDSMILRNILSMTLKHWLIQNLWSLLRLWYKLSAQNFEVTLSYSFHRAFLYRMTLI